MKNSRSEKLSEYLMNVDEKILSDAYEIDDAEKLGKYKKTENAKKPFYMTAVFRKAAAAAACFVLVLGVIAAVPSMFKIDLRDVFENVLRDGADIGSVTFDWPEWKTAEEIEAAANNIYVGKVTDISFEVIDYHTGKPADSSAGGSTRLLYTVYTVEVDSSLKGTSPTVVKIAREGGTKGYDDEALDNLLKKYGIKSVSVSMPDDTLSLSLGETYLFCTNRAFDTYDWIINPTQYAFSLGSDTATAIAAMFE